MGERVFALAISICLCAILLVIFHFSLPEIAANIVIDKDGVSYPLSIQNVMWFALFVGVGELFVRYISGGKDIRELERGYLPEDQTTVLQSTDLGRIYGLVRSSPTATTQFLPRLIQRAIMQFQSSRSVDQSTTMINSTLELFIHEIDLRYNMVRYIMWLIPSLGFIGTVVGIVLALSYAGDPANIEDPALLTEVTKRLAVAFYTTLVALIMASALVFAANVIQSREERALNLAGQYCLDNLINRLYSSK